MSVSIANGALDRIGASPITSLSDGKDGDLVSRHLKRAAELVLREIFWSEATTNCCLKRLHVCDDCHLPDGFCYAFELPKDFIRAYQVHEGCPCDTCKCNRPLDYKTKPKSYEDKRRTQRVTSIDNEENWRVITVKTDTGKCRALVAPCPSVQLEYVCYPDDLDQLPIDICIAIELQLAMRIAPQMQDNRALRDDIMKEYERHMMDAELRSTAQDQEEIYYDDGELLDARHSLAGW